MTRSPNGAGPPDSLAVNDRQEPDERVSSGEYERAPCPDCGSRTLNDAETKCKPLCGIDGEYYCAVPEEDVDGEGHLLRPTALFYKRLDAWVDDQLAKDGAR